MWNTTPHTRLRKNQQMMSLFFFNNLEFSTTKWQILKFKIQSSFLSHAPHDFPHKEDDVHIGDEIRKNEIGKAGEGVNEKSAQGVTCAIGKGEKYSSSISSRRLGRNAWET